ncbi:MAG: hypothetical protein M1825_004013 [Sarcosagium campestre]|nr:MAG: hypothetical protein M1825_004013 [Sarcosagium campestre]
MADSQKNREPYFRRDYTRIVLDDELREGRLEKYNTTGAHHEHPQPPKLRRTKPSSTVRPLSVDLTKKVSSIITPMSATTFTSLVAAEVPNNHEQGTAISGREFPLTNGNVGGVSAKESKDDLHLTRPTIRPRTRTLEERSGRNKTYRNMYAQTGHKGVPPSPVNASSFKEPSNLQKHFMAALTERELGANSQLSPASSRNPFSSSKPSTRPEGSSAKDRAIIKVGKMMFWDGRTSSVPNSPSIRPRKVPKRKDGQPGRKFWQNVSCVLRDNGELKFFNENDVTLVSVVQLSQLPRSSIQRLDRTVLDEEHCIILHPNFLKTSRKPSFDRRIYLALDSRMLFEVWFVLMNAFAVPEFHEPSPGEHDSGGPELAQAGADPVGVQLDDLFRVVSTLSLRIIEARMHPARPRTSPESRTAKEDTSTGSYFAEVVLEDQARARTVVRSGSNTPFWREDFDFTDLSECASEVSVVVRQEESNPKPLDRSMNENLVDLVIATHALSIARGQVRMSLNGQENVDQTERWLPIVNVKNEPVGDMLLKSRVEKLVVLTSANYTALSDLLHDFSNSLSACFAECLRPGKLERLSEILLNIYQASGNASHWLMELIREEVEGPRKDGLTERIKQVESRKASTDSQSPAVERDQMQRALKKQAAAEANLLFRGNSLLTKAFEIHIRRVGKDYLDGTLRDRIREIDEANLDCEVDPSRLASPSDKERNWQNLVRLFRRVWNSIRDSAAQCPGELQMIFLHVRKSSDEQFQHLLHTVTYSSVSGLLFLRFFCPAILNPKLFGLLSHHPRPSTQRTLTLIAKSLQGLANMTSFGAKEPWMEPMNRSLTVHRQEFRDFIDAICSSPRPSSASVPPSYATPSTIVARLPAASREAIPTLPYLLDPAANFAALVTLWLDPSAHRTPAPRVVSTTLTDFHAECLRLHARARDLLVEAQGSERAPARLSHVWAGLRRQLDNALPAENPPFASTTIELELEQPSHWPGPDASPVTPGSAPYVEANALESGSPALVNGSDRVLSPDYVAKFSSFMTGLRKKSK